MGTRSLTFVYDGSPDDFDDCVVCMYRQFDGYLEGHGKELAEFLKGMSIVNGMTSGQPVKIANGMGCLAAQIVAHFKQEPGGIYLQNTRHELEEYNYHVFFKDGKLKFFVTDCYNVEISPELTPEEFLEEEKNEKHN